MKFLCGIESTDQNVKTVEIFWNHFYDKWLKKNNLFYV